MDLPITQEQIDLWENDHVLIQNAMPQLTPDQREFLMTGYTAEDWAILFPPEEELCGLCDGPLPNCGCPGEWLDEHHSKDR